MVFVFRTATGQPSAPNITNLATGSQIKTGLFRGSDTHKKAAASSCSRLSYIVFIRILLHPAPARHRLCARAAFAGTGARPEWIPGP
jgi:hypothetical protein